MDDEEVAHDYESLDDYINPVSTNTRPAQTGLLNRGRSEGDDRYGQLPTTNRCDVRRISTGSTEFNAANRLSSSLPRNLQPLSNMFTIPTKSRYPIPTRSGPVTPPPPRSQLSKQLAGNLQRAATIQSIVPPPIDRRNKPPNIPPKSPKPTQLERKDPVIISKPFRLSNFCTSEAMPKMVRVSAGYYGDSEKTSISEGEEFVFYLVKTTLAVPANPMGATGTSESFHIPINSFLKIAVIDQHSDSIKKYVYSSLIDLMKNRSVCPSILCVTKDFFVKAKDTTLSAGTLLFPDEKPSRKFLSGQVYLRCRTIKNKTFDLSMDCAAEFSTHPADVQLYVAEYLTMVDKFPVNVQLFHGDCEDTNESSEVISNIGLSLTLLKPVKQKSIIAKTDVEGTKKDNPITVEIPFDLPIEVEAIERPEENMDQIYSEVMDLYENFNPESVEKSYTTLSSVLQKKLNKEVSYVPYHHYQKMDIPFQLECPNTDYEPLQAVLKQREKFLADQQASASSNKVDVETLKEENRKLQAEIEQLREKKHAKFQTVDISVDHTKLSSEDNVKELKTMDIVGISQLLEKMGLPQYVEKFKEQQVDGELLVELDESDLSDLVESSLHKKRLMLIATGQASIRKYFDTENPYCTLVDLK